MLYKTEHWNLPNHHPWGIPLSLLYMNRFAELLIHKPGEGFFLYLLAVLLSPIVVNTSFSVSVCSEVFGVSYYGLLLFS